MVKDLRRESELISKESIKECQIEKSFIEKQLNDNANMKLILSDEDSQNLNNVNSNNIIKKSKKKKCPTFFNISRVLTLILLGIILAGIVWFLFSNDSSDDEERKLLGLKLKKLNRTINRTTTLNFAITPASNISINNRMILNNELSSQNNFYSSNLFVFIATVSIVLLIILFVFAGSLMPYLKRSIKSETFSGRSIALSVFYDDRYNQEMIDFLEKNEINNNKKSKNSRKNEKNKKCNNQKDIKIPQIVINNE